MTPTNSTILQAGPTTQQLQIDGFTINATCSIHPDKTNAPLVILIHGSFLSLRSWNEVILPLSNTASIIAYDRPAFGWSSRPLPDPQHAISYAPEAQSDLIIALIHKLGFRKAILIGNSTGGTIALLTAIRHPEAVSGLVLVGAMIYSGYATSEVPKAIKPMLRLMTPLFSKLMKRLITALYDRNIKGFWHKPERLGAATLSAYRSDLMHGNWARTFWELFLETHHLHLDRAIPSLPTPALVITGVHDLTVKTDESIRLARELPNATLITIPDCGHLPQEEQPAAFINAVKQFMANRQP